MKPAVWVVVVASVLLVSAPRPAHAAPIIINTGDDIMFVRELPASAIEAMPDLKGYHVGYKYSRFGIFWVDLWRWSGELCIYQGTTYEPVPAEAVALVGGDAAPLAYHLPPGLVALACGFVLFVVMQLRRSKLLFLAIAGGLGVVTAGLYALGLGFSTLFVGFAAFFVLMQAFARPPPEAVSFRAPPEASAP